MRYAFYLEGRAYSRNKEAFKALLKKHGVRWKGTFEEPWWGSGAEKVEATFQRDPVREVTTAATLVWTGKRLTDFLEELKAWVLSAGGRVEKEEEHYDSHRPARSRELEFWDYLNKPDERYMAAEGRPERWIQLDIQEWKRRRREREKEIGGS